MSRTFELALYWNRLWMVFVSYFSPSFSSVSLCSLISMSPGTNMPWGEREVPVDVSQRSPMQIHLRVQALAQNNLTVPQMGLGATLVMAILGSKPTSRILINPFLAGDRVFKGTSLKPWLFTSWAAIHSWLFKMFSCFEVLGLFRGTFSWHELCTKSCEVDIWIEFWVGQVEFRVGERKGNAVQSLL